MVSILIRRYAPPAFIASLVFLVIYMYSSGPKVTASGLLNNQQQKETEKRKVKVLSADHEQKKILKSKSSATQASANYEDYARSIFRKISAESYYSDESEWTESAENRHKRRERDRQRKLEARLQHNNRPKIARHRRKKNVKTRKTRLKTNKDIFKVDSASKQDVLAQHVKDSIAEEAADLAKSLGAPDVPDVEVKGGNGIIKNELSSVEKEAEELRPPTSLKGGSDHSTIEQDNKNVTQIMEQYDVSLNSEIINHNLKSLMKKLKVAKSNENNV